MVKSYKLQCWKCLRKYLLPLDITDQKEFIVTCPYCKAEAVVDLRPIRKEAIPVYRHGEENEEQRAAEIPLPAILPTRRRKQSD